MTHILIPREPSPALLRPFVGCPQEELPQAYAAMIRIAEVERARAGSQCLAQIEEPAGAAPAAVAPQGDKDDSLLLCASDLQHSAIYDSHSEMQDCARSVADRIKALAAPALEAPPAVTGRTAPRNDDERAAAQFFADNPGAALLAWPLYLARDKSPALEAPAAPAMPPLTPDEARWAARSADNMRGPSDTTSGTEYAMAGAMALAKKLAAAPQAPAAPLIDDDGQLSEEVRELITGMTVSVDVSTGEHDASNRLFGEVTEVMEYDGGSDKHKVVLLVQSPEANFKAAPAAPAVDAWGDGWYLQDTRSYVGNDVLWWAKDGKGYTTDVSKAHVFTREEAFSQAAMRGVDRAWPKAYIDGKTRPAVDMQYINHDQAIAAQAAAKGF